jgi:hypothetical protein
MKSHSPDAPTEWSLPLGVYRALARHTMAGLLALVFLVLVLFSLGSAARAWEDGGDGLAVAQTPDALGPAQAAGVTGNYPNCRFGAGERFYPVISYPVSSLNLGWYVDWKTQADPPHPGGAEYVQMLHVNGTHYSPYGDTLAARIAANPGALWLIGNEPDCIHQDNVLPQDYAEAYHDAYLFIKTLDPTARVSAGGIVQPTPLRMQYLDAVLNTYVSRYGEHLPTDAWNIHSYILQERRGAEYWGADIPPGFDGVNEGIVYALDDTDNLAIFQQRIVQFRQWMHDRGYRATPLLITEYGSLVPHSYEGWTQERAQVFMVGTFDFLRTASDPNLGYLADENRLVQRWLWYSLDDSLNYGGALFDQYTRNPTLLGVAFSTYTGALSPTVDLLAVDVGQVGPIPHSPLSPVTVTLRARVSNVGNVALTTPVTVRFLDGEGHSIGPDQVFSGTLAGCAMVKEITMTWPDVAPGAHVVRMVVDPEATTSEGNEDNNQAVGLVLVAKGQTFLPLVVRRGQ